MQGPGENPPRQCEAVSPRRLSRNGKRSLPRRPCARDGGEAITESYRCPAVLRAISNGHGAGPVPGAPITSQITTAIASAARM